MFEIIGFLACCVFLGALSFMWLCAAWDFSGEYSFGGSENTIVQKVLCACAGVFIGCLWLWLLSHISINAVFT